MRDTDEASQGGAEPETRPLLTTPQRSLGRQREVEGRQGQPSSVHITSSQRGQYFIILIVPENSKEK